MSAVILAFPHRRREHVEIEKQVDADARSTWHFIVVAADGRRVPMGVRDDAEDVLADALWFRRGGMRVVMPVDFEMDVTRAIAESFANGLVADMARLRG